MKYIKFRLLLIVVVFPFFGKAQTRDNAGLQGSEGAVSGFFDTVNPVNYPAGANGWWHLLDVRHSNTANNFAMQFAGNFFNQDLFFRKTSGYPNTAWSRVLLERDDKVGIGTDAPENAESWSKVLEVKGTTDSKILVSSGVVNTGIWTHNLGYYDSPAGGMVGTATNHPFSIITNKSAKMVVMTNGDIGIGTLTPKEKLSVNGKIRAQEIKVETANWPDYVFAKEYQLPSLAETEKQIKEKGHLPGIPSAQDVKENGIDLGEMNAKLLQKVEELTLHLIDIKKENQTMKDQLLKLENMIEKK